MSVAYVSRIASKYESAVYVFLHQSMQRLVNLLQFSKSPVMAVGRECITCPVDEGVVYLRLDNTDPHRSDVHFAVMHDYGREVMSKYDGIVEQAREVVAKLGTASAEGRYDEFMEGCVKYLPSVICDTVVSRLKSIKSDKKALKHISELSYVMPLIHVNAVISRVKDELMCIKFSNFGYLCYFSDIKGVVDASAVDADPDKYLKAVRGEYSVLQGDDLEKYRLFTWLFNTCKKEKHICDALLKYYISGSDFLHHLILHKVCVEHKNTVYCPSQIDRVLSIPKSAFERM